MSFSCKHNTARLIADPAHSPRRKIPTALVYPCSMDSSPSLAKQVAVQKAEGVLDRVMAAQKAEQEAAIKKAISEYETQLLTSPVKPNTK